MTATVTSTTLEFGLVSAPVKLKAATGKKGTELKLASPEGHSVKQVYVDEETGEIVGTRADCRRGIFNGDFHEVPPDQLALIDEESKLESLKVEGFIPLNDVPWERAKGAYYLAPEKGKPNVKPLVLLREGMRKRKVAAVTRLTLKAKTYPAVIYAAEVAPGKWGLLLNTLTYADEFAQAKEAAECLEGFEPDTATVNLAGRLIDQLNTSRAVLDSWTDDRAEKREELIAQMLAGQTIVAAEKPATKKAPDADLADLLKASLEEQAA